MTDVLFAGNQWSRNVMLDPSLKSMPGRTTLRRLTFFRNGDRYFLGKQINLNPQDYLSLRHFLQELSTMIDLPYGIRRLFTPRNGSEITDLNLLKDGGSYVCASFEPFQKLEYSTSNNPRVIFNHQTCKDALIAFFLLSLLLSFLFYSFNQIYLLFIYLHKNNHFFSSTPSLSELLLAPIKKLFNST